jgi:hypothetical protein
MTALERAIYRFLREIFAYGIVLLVKFILENVEILHVPIYLVPVISAVLNALAKFIREKWAIDIKL